MSDSREINRRGLDEEPFAVVAKTVKGAGFAIPAMATELPDADKADSMRIDLDHVRMKTRSSAMIPEVSWLIFGKTGLAGKLLGLGEYEQETLRLLLRMLIANDFGGLVRKLETADAGALEDAAAKLADIAASGRSFCEEETRLLFDVFQGLGLDSAAILRGYAAGGLKKSREARKAGLHVENIAVDIRIDMNVVREKIRETESLGKLLGEIFEDDDIENAGVVTAAVDAVDFALAGLDESEKAFALTLCSKESWGRIELEAAAKEAGLMLDGALETINAACYEAFDAPFFDGADPVEINMEVAREICK